MGDSGYFEVGKEKWFSCGAFASAVRLDVMNTSIWSSVLLEEAPSDVDCKRVARRDFSPVKFAPRNR